MPLTTQAIILLARELETGDIIAHPWEDRLVTLTDVIHYEDNGSMELHYGPRAITLVREDHAISRY